MPARADVSIIHRIITDQTLGYCKGLVTHVYKVSKDWFSNTQAGCQLYYRSAIKPVTQNGITIGKS